MNVVIKSINVSISPENKAPFIDSTNNSISYRYTLTGGDNSAQYTDEKIYLHVNKSIEIFRIDSSIKKRLDPSISGFFSLLFGEKKGYYPTSCTYKIDKEGNEFVLVN